MKEITTTPSDLPALSPAKQTAIQRWRQQPKQYYATLPTATPRKMIEADTPSLWELRRQLGHPATIAILVSAFIHAAKLVNLDKNLTAEQIGEAANDTLEGYGYLKVEEIKYLLKRALRTENVYGRLDYNVLMRWVKQYDDERTEEAIRLSEQKETQLHNEPKPSPDAITFREYIGQLEARAKTDESAAERLAQINAMMQSPKALTREEKQAKKREFLTWKTFSYLTGKKQ